MFLRCVLLSVILCLTTVLADSCQTARGRNGECKPITECPLFRDYFNRSLNPNLIAYLKKSECGFAGKVPKVCCPVVSSQLRNLLADPSTCGFSSGSKIIGGEVTELDEFPWMALLQYEKNGQILNNCGGALISKRYILTAAHCINPYLTKVRLGEYDLSKDRDCLKTFTGEDCADPAIDIPVEETIVHEGYVNEGNQQDDIALVRLKEEVEISGDYVKPICLPAIGEYNKTYFEENLFVAGWGVTESGSTSNIKLKVQVPVRQKSFCETTYRRFNFNLTLSENQFCVGGEKGKDSCKGDSGGPLMKLRRIKNQDLQWYAAGIVSFGPQPCGMAKWGGVYTRVSQYIPWIHANLKP